MASPSVTQTMPSHQPLMEANSLAKQVPPKPPMQRKELPRRAKANRPEPNISPSATVMTLKPPPGNFSGSRQEEQSESPMSRQKKTTSPTQDRARRWRTRSRTGKRSRSRRTCDDETKTGRRRRIRSSSRSSRTESDHGTPAPPESSAQKVLDKASAAESFWSQPEIQTKQSPPPAAPGFVAPDIENKQEDEALAAALNAAVNQGEAQQPSSAASHNTQQVCDSSTTQTQLAGDQNLLMQQSAFQQGTAQPHQLNPFAQNQCVAPVQQQSFMPPQYALQQQQMALQQQYMQQQQHIALQQQQYMQQQQHMAAAAASHMPFAQQPFGAQGLPQQPVVVDEEFKQKLLCQLLQHSPSQGM